MVTKYLRPEICSTCGGVCCSRMAGACHPSDFKSRQHIIDALKGGRYCIDWWVGDPRPNKSSLDKAYFIRPSGKGLEGKLLDPTWGNIGCTFWSDSGCELEPEQRPRGCRLLEPLEDKQCKDHSGGKQGAALAWLKTGIVNIIREVEEKL